MSLPEAVSLDPALATFLAIHKAGSISAASAAMHLSQPAITRRLQALERQLRAPLFDRTRAGLRLSSVGEVLLPHAERAHAAELDALCAVAEHLAGTTGRVTIGVVGSLAGRWLSDVLATVVAEQPTVDLVVSTATSSQIRDQVLRGDLAVGISYARPTAPDLEVRVLFHESLVVIAAPGHRCVGKRVKLGDLRDERWLMFPELPHQPESSGTIARSLIEQHQVPPDMIRPIDSLSAQRSLARAGYGLAFVPTSAVTDDLANGDLAVIDVSDAQITAPVTLITRRGAYQSGATRSLVDRLTAGERPPSRPTAVPPARRPPRRPRSRSR